MFVCAVSGAASKLFQRRIPDSTKMKMEKKKGKTSSLFCFFFHFPMEFAFVPEYVGCAIAGIELDVCFYDGSDYAVRAFTSSAISWKYNFVPIWLLLFVIK